MRAFCLAIALLSVAAQETKLDEHAYCWNPRSSGSFTNQRETDKNAHRCECRLMCTYDPDGTVSGDQEDGTCKLYCKRDRCLCHVEEACEKS